MGKKVHIRLQVQEKHQSYYCLVRVRLQTEQCTRRRRATCRPIFLLSRAGVVYGNGARADRIARVTESVLLPLIRLLSLLLRALLFFTHRVGPAHAAVKREERTGSMRMGSGFFDAVRYSSCREHASAAHRCCRRIGDHSGGSDFGRDNMRRECTSLNLLLLLQYRVLS